MFAAVMSDTEICRKVLELALRIPVSEVHIQTEKTMAYHAEYHSVCLYVCASDTNRIGLTKLSWIAGWRNGICC